MQKLKVKQGGKKSYQENNIDSYSILNKIDFKTEKCQD